MSTENVKPWIKDGEEYKTLRCSFCQKKRAEVRVLIVGPQPRPSFICDECVDVCIQIIAEDAASRSATASTESEDAPR